MMKFVLKMMKFVFKMMICVFKMISQRPRGHPSLIGDQNHKRYAGPCRSAAQSSRRSAPQQAAAPAAPDMNCLMHHRSHHFRLKNHQFLSENHHVIHNNAPEATLGGTTIIVPLPAAGYRWIDPATQWSAAKSIISNRKFLVFDTQIPRF